jgi:ParB family transcriptional regulator, chromosome partitioning protein
VTTKKGAKLGRGLDALFLNAKNETGQGQSFSHQHVQNLDLEKVKPAPNQPRKEFDEGKIAKLAESIKQSGVLQPIVVRRNADAYEIVFGERRYRAAKAAGLKTIPAIIRDLDEKEKLKISLVENLQREDLNPIEAAWAYQELQKMFSMSHEEIGRVVGLDRTTVTNALRLLRLPTSVVEAVRKGDISEGHARALLSFTKEQEILKIAARIIKEGLSVRQVERIAKDEKDSRETPKKKEKNIHLRRIEESLADYLGARVRLQQGRKISKIVIEYTDNDQLSRILELMRVDAD